MPPLRGSAMFVATDSMGCRPWLLNSGSSSLSAPIADFPRNRNNPQALRSFAPILETEPGRSPLRGSFIDRVAIGRNVRGFSLNTFSER